MPDSRTLYVTDLDGTLLMPSGQLSQATIGILGDLIEDGVLVTCATARSWTTTKNVLDQFSFRLPVVLHDGALTYDAASRIVLDQQNVAMDAVVAALDILRRRGIAPLINTVNGAQERISWVNTLDSAGIRSFWGGRQNDPRNSPKQCWEALPVTGVLNIAAIGPRPELIDALDELRSSLLASCEVVDWGDTYGHQGMAWLNIVAPNISKAHGLTVLARHVGAARIVVFGDNYNDLPMFRLADQGFAVANACAAVLDVASAVIGSNHEDGVATWLKANASPSLKSM